MNRWILAGMLLLLAACGQAGSLYLPDHPPSEQQKQDQQKQQQPQSQ